MRTAQQLEELAASLKKIVNAFIKISASMLWPSHLMTRSQLSRRSQMVLRLLRMIFSFMITRQIAFQSAFCPTSDECCFCIGGVTDFNGDYPSNPFTSCALISHPLK